MVRRRIAALLIATSGLLMFGAASAPPAQACGYEDYVCDVVVYVLDRACVKFDVC